MPDGVAARYAVRASHVRFSGAVMSVVSDEVEMPDGGTAMRDYVIHPGAVGIVALDEAGRVLLLHQYRHPVRATLWELPAGLLDVDGEGPLKAAQRELHEEAALTADRWDLLIDALNSPGGSDEKIRIFLARGIQHVPDAERFTGVAEESELELQWVDLDAAVSWALAGRIENAMCVIGVLAAARLRDQDWQPLRAADEPWSGSAAG